MSFTLGLTGSIGMGKSTVLNMFETAEIPIWSADAAVHELYSSNILVIDAIADLIPGALNDAGLDRAVMRNAISNSPQLLKKIEKIVHPAVAAHREEFLTAHLNEAIVVLEIPLLFELGLESTVDAVIVVSTDADTQKKRVLARKTMSESEFDQILAKQVPDYEKRARADYIIESKTMGAAAKTVHEIVASVLNKIKISGHA
ncbi:MAG: dephospho-CoA kinase [Pseudomonadota bacterium]